MDRIIEKENTGFSNLSTQSNTRLINADGSINVVKKGQSLFDKFSLYRLLILTSWSRFFFFLGLTYFFVNLLFAFIYFSIGVDHLGGATYTGKWDAFLECFFFSSQTFTTVGYGRINPVGIGVNIIASIEAFSGVLLIAIFTGLLYGRFSRPVVKIIKSQNAVIVPHKNAKALMFRIVNAKNSILSDAEVEIRLSMLKSEQGTIKRKYFEIKPEIKKITLFTLSWTVVHLIKEDSPFWEMTEEEIKTSDAEIIILFRAFDDTFSQTINSWLSYKCEEIIWDAKFKSIIEYQDDIVSVDLSKINEIEKIII